MSMKKLFAIAIASTCLLDTVSAAPQAVWITADDAAYTELRKLQPSLVAVQSQALPASIPAEFVSQGKTVTTVMRHVIKVDEALLPHLHGAMHQNQHRCGGYKRYASKSEAVAALTRPWRKGDVTTPSYAITQSKIVTQLLPSMQASNIVATINGLTAFKNRYYTSQNGVAASDWLYRQWKSLANGQRSDIMVEQIAHKGFPQKSVVLTIAGTDLADEIVVLGGHIDTIHDDADGDDDTTENTRAPGADDDASGLASLTEAARVIINSGFKPRRTIKFMAYAAEEIELNGSRDMAKLLAKADVVGVLQLDMTNYEGSDRDIYMCSDYTNKAQNKFLIDLVHSYLRAPLYPQPLTTGWTECGEEGSDHVSWHERGFAASMPFESAEGEKNAHIHSEHDTLANSDSSGQHALKFGRLAAAFAVELGAGNQDDERASTKGRLRRKP